MKRPLVVFAHEDPLIRSGLKATVENTSDEIHVETVDSFASLLRYNEDVQNIVSIVDIDLPGMNGMTGLARLMRRTPPPRVCLTMPTISREFVTRCLSLGIMACIEWKRLPYEVFDAICALAEERLYFSKLSDDRLISHAGGLSDLTPQQMNVLQSLATGKSNKEIGRELGICEGTVKVHLNAAFRALGVCNRTSAVVKLRNLGLAEKARTGDLFDAIPSSRPRAPDGPTPN